MTNNSPIARVISVNNENENNNISFSEKYKYYIIGYVAIASLAIIVLLASGLIIMSFDKYSIIARDLLISCLMTFVSLIFLVIFLFCIECCNDKSNDCNNQTEIQV